ncbi:MAG: TRAP transporter small permease [Burkholderiaceae bacterium]|nr:TRAP transporter small permease [Burkholderiaceae bacterium]
MRSVLWLVESTAAAFMLAIAVLTAGNVLLRNAFGLTIPDWYDGGRLLLGIATFWGIAVATYAGRHICVDFVWESLKTSRGKRRLDILATAIVFGFFGALTVMMWIKVSATGAQATSDLRFPIVGFYAASAAGATAGALLCLLRMWRLWHGQTMSDESETLSHGS